MVISSKERDQGEEDRGVKRDLALTVKPTHHVSQLKPWSQGGSPERQEHPWNHGKGSRSTLKTQKRGSWRYRGRPEFCTARTEALHEQEPLVSPSGAHEAAVVPPLRLPLNAHRTSSPQIREQLQPGNRPDPCTAKTRRCHQAPRDLQPYRPQT